METVKENQTSQLNIIIVNITYTVIIRKEKNTCMKVKHFHRKENVHVHKGKINIVSSNTPTRRTCHLAS